MFTLTSIKLHDGINFLAILLQETDTHYSVYTKKKGFSLIKKKGVQNIRVIRNLTKRENNSITHLINLNSELKEYTHNIEKLTKCINEIQSEEDAIIRTIKIDIFDKRKLNSFIKFENIKYNLTPQGFMNIYDLQRKGKDTPLKLDFDNNEYLTIAIDNAEPIKVNIEFVDSIVDILNQPYNEVSAKLIELIKSIDNTINHQKIKCKNTAKKHSSSNIDIDMNINDIKHLLNEDGYKTLKKLQESQLLKFESNGDIVLNSSLLPIQFIKKMVKDEKTFANMLNGNFEDVLFINSLIKIMNSNNQSDEQKFNFKKDEAPSMLLNSLIPLINEILK